VVKRNFKERVMSESGQALPTYILFSLLLIMFLWVIAESGVLIVHRMKLQNAADASALSAAVFRARNANGLAAVNKSRNYTGGGNVWFPPVAAYHSAKSIVNMVQGDVDGFTESLEHDGGGLKGGGIDSGGNLDGSAYHTAADFAWSIFKRGTTLAVIPLPFIPPIYIVYVDDLKIGSWLYGLYQTVLPYFDMTLAGVNSSYGVIASSVIIPRLNGMSFALPIGVLYDSVLGDFDKYKSLIGVIGTEWKTGNISVNSTSSIRVSIGTTRIGFPVTSFPDPLSKGFEAKNVPTYVTFTKDVKNSSDIIEFNRIDYVVYSKKRKSPVTARLFGVRDRFFYTMSSATIYPDGDYTPYIPHHGNKPGKNKDAFSFMFGASGADNDAMNAMNLFKPTLSMTSLDKLLVDKVIK